MSNVNPLGRPEMNGIPANHKARPQQAQPNGAAKPQPGQDQVQLSEHAKMLSKLRENPVRQDLVNQVRTELDQGTYETDGKLNQALDELGKELG